MVEIKKIENFIFLIRGHRVMVDNHLSELYGVPAKYLNQQARRNINRFPADFMFQLTSSETKLLRLQFATSKTGSGGRRYSPFVFTEQGVAMLSSVLNSERAIKVNIQIMRTFVGLRQIMASDTGLAKKIEALEEKYDGQFKTVFEAIRLLMLPPEPKRKQIGFTGDN
jgi:hypothetical protein